MPSSRGRDSLPPIVMRILLARADTGEGGTLDGCLSAQCYMAIKHEYRHRTVISGRQRLAIFSTGSEAALPFVTCGSGETP
jgi:hypothetical protein